MRISRINKDSLLPQRKHNTDAGLDLFADKDCYINGWGIIPTGVKIALPEKHVGLLMPKSRSNFLVGASVVDEGYRGEIFVKIYSPVDLKISKGDQIAQLLVIPVIYPTIVEQDLVEFAEDKTDRGETGGIASQYKTAVFITETKENK